MARMVQTAEIALRFAPHALALLVVISAFAKLPQPFSPVGWLFVIAPLVEKVLSDDCGPRRTITRGERTACWLVPWLWLPLQAAVLLTGILLVRDAPDLAAALCIALPAGMLSGMFGMTMAHELMHRREPSARAAAWLLLSACGYGHFFVEHSYGHHRRAGTRADAATARLGESLYVFLPRTILGGLRSAWQLEADRLRRHGYAALGPRNRVAASMAIWILFCIATAQAAGLPGLVFFIVQGATSVAILETMNYIQHYGLVRREEHTRGEVSPGHTWDCASRFTNLVLSDLGRHADHHKRPGCGSHSLDNRADAPRLPAGYFTMFVFALLPPFWMQLMDPRAMLVRERLDRELAPSPTQTEEKEDAV